MKITYGLWGVLFLLAFLTAGFIPAVLLTGLAAGSAISTGFSVQDKLEGGPNRRMLGR